MGLFDFFQKGKEEKLPTATPKAPDIDLHPTSELTKHVVIAGDSLSKIAKKYYGDSMKWKLIHDANKELIPKPDLIHPGQILVIPQDTPSK
ncbi:LysM domain-containing protein [Algoriphagus ratkowskyi]|uniref:LysM domain-containing protein n=1 Tax=Algoriphagus ratkowskyi TaxID=57028 RepID=A0A2W7R9U0_9BACT|nr:LysM peptidoglycan-binding domain-containing protein [Algoriphagus ratkowskyi]PZX57688.1 LysM domain-containing protein [Algoriphagus ratkowskyi]TXD78958.1 LysM peptidoglycan-binding domain-containing protein [Algoriphagus ratkowskyi]